MISKVIVITGSTAAISEHPISSWNERIIFSKITETDKQNMNNIELKNKIFLQGIKAFFLILLTA